MIRYATLNSRRKKATVNYQLSEQVRLHKRTEDMLRLEKAAQLMRQNFHKVKMKVKANQRQNDKLRRTCQKHEKTISKQW